MHQLLFVWSAAGRNYEKSCFFCICFLLLGCGFDSTCQESFGIGNGRDARRSYLLTRKREGAKYGVVSVQIVAASDIGGYGALAVSGHGKARVFGAAFGCRSLIEAQKRAIEACRHKGGSEGIRQFWLS